MRLCGADGDAERSGSPPLAEDAWPRGAALEAERAALLQRKTSLALAADDVLKRGGLLDKLLKLEAVSGPPRS
eukprot:tig00000180_g13637.t1